MAGATDVNITVDVQDKPCIEIEVSEPGEPSRWICLDLAGAVDVKVRLERAIAALAAATEGTK